MPFALRLPRTLPFHVALAMLFAASGTMWGIWIARIPGVASKLDISTAQLGTVLPVFSAGALVAFPITANLTSRFGSRNVIRAAGVLRGLLFPALAFAPNALWLMAALAFAGFAHGALDIALNAQGVEIERRTVGSILSRAHGSFSLGALVGSASIGFLATAGLPLEWQFLLPGGLAVLAFSTVGIFLIDDDATPTRATKRLATKRKWRGVGLPPRALWTIGAIALITGIADEAIAEWSTLFIRQELEATPLVASLAYSVYSLAMLVGRFSGDTVSQRIPPMRLLQISGTLGTIGMVGGALLNSPYAMIGGIAVVGLGFSVIYPTLYRLAGTTPDVSRAKGLATIATIAYLGFLVGPLIMGPLASLTSLRVAFIVVGMLCLAIPVLGREKPAPAPTVEMPEPSFDPERPPEPNPYSL